MQLRALANFSLPKLAWVAGVNCTSGIVTLRHGSLVEVRNTFFIEGVWNGPFENGGFGETDCVFGTGAVLTSDGIRFVSSASTTDYLFYQEKDGTLIISNSLPLLLSSIGDALDPHCQEYPAICDSILDGINDHRRIIPTVHGSVQRLIYRNLDVTRDKVQEVEKRMPPRFSTFAEYRDYLADHYALIAANARAYPRAYRLDICSTQSKGYDSTAMNAIAAPYGIDRVFSVTKAKSNSHLATYDPTTLPDDDGTEIARALNLPCIPLNRQSFAREFDQEHLYYCGLHHNQDANLKGIRKYLTNVSLLLTGINGDVVWARQKKAVQTGMDSSIRRGDLGGHGMGELRLIIGFIQLPFPFIGARRKADIVAITESSEMAHWRLDNAYDRPIPRRIAEESGVPRHLFGQTKMASAVIFPPPSIPYGRVLRMQFFCWLTENRMMSGWKLALWPLVARVNALISVKPRWLYYAERIVSKLIRRDVQCSRLWTRLDGALFCYCVNRTAHAYSQDLSEEKNYSSKRSTCRAGAPAT